MAQFFRGNLAGLIIRSGKLENKKVIDCLYTCKEGLDVQLPEEVASAVKVSEHRESCRLVRLNLLAFLKISHRALLSVSTFASSKRN